MHKQTGEERAVKIINKEKLSSKQMKQFANEVQILRQLDHPNIIKLYEIFEDEDYFYLVQE
jgi:serine/threonine protein kinase